jgi:signal transduction histidine kinase
MKDFNKKKLILIILFGIILNVTSYIIWNKISFNNINDKEYLIYINRTHNKIINALNTSNIDNLNNILSKYKDTYKSITDIDYIIPSENKNELITFFKNTDNSKKFEFKYIDDTNIIIKYEITSFENSYKIYFIYTIIVFNLFWICILLIYIYHFLKFIRPINKLTKFSINFTKGHFNEILLQEKNGPFKKLIWSLDILREKLAEEKHTNIKLEKDRKTLVASLSHDIRTPLSIILNYTLALKDEIYTETKDIENALDIIINKSNIIEKLTSDLLGITKNSVEKIKVVPTDYYFKDLYNSIKQFINYKINLLDINYKINNLNTNPLIYIDFDRLTEVFDNILENAIKYGNNKHIEIKWEITENNLLLNLYNSGNNISNKDLNHIFSIFYRSENSANKPGFGLGLYISKKIMKAMNGDIYISNTENGVNAVLVIAISS